MAGRRLIEKSREQTEVSIVFGVLHRCDLVWAIGNTHIPAFLSSRSGTSIEDGPQGAETWAAQSPLEGPRTRASCQLETGRLFPIRLAARLRAVGRWGRRSRAAYLAALPAMESRFDNAGGGQEALPGRREGGEDGGLSVIVIWRIVSRASLVLSFRSYQSAY